MNTENINRLPRLIKQVGDRIIAAIALVILSPLLLMIAIAIYINMGGPVIFAQPRPGKDGKIFTFYKFRTMVADKRDNSGDEPSFTGTLPPDIQRITPLGDFLRKFSLDEFPQLWNVLKGDMSLVGPRPLRVYYLSRYTPQQARRHEVLPGITGLAQVKGRNAVDWEERFLLDVWYVDNWSLWLDLKILFLTIGQVLKPEGINEQNGLYTAEGYRGQLDKSAHQQSE